MQDIMNLLQEINPTQICPGSGSSSDTAEWVRVGVPGVELCNANENYFDWHHTYGDAMTVLDRDDLDKCTIVWATVAYVVGNLDTILPRVCPISGSNPPQVFITYGLLAASAITAHLLTGRRYSLM